MFANAKVAAATIALPLVVHKASKVFTQSWAPACNNAIRLSLSMLRTCENDAKERSGSTAARQRYVLVNPEFSPPIEAARSPAVAGRDAAIEWQWDPKGTDTMCPFWAVRRMTRKQLDAAANASDEYHERVGVRRRFNCELRPYVMTCVNVGITALGHGPLTMTRALEDPFLVNTVDLEDGEQLLFEIQELALKTVTKRDWKQAHHQLEATKHKCKVVTILAHHRSARCSG